jgi:hypothetical protein
LYGDGSAGANIARVLAEVPLSIEKRLTYETNGREGTGQSGVIKMGGFAPEQREAA